MNFVEYFSVENISNYYTRKVQYNSSVGLDFVTKENFERDLNQEFIIIHRKVLNGIYEFTGYREVLVAKGQFKPPRTIAIPTIRDRITLGLISDYLRDLYGELVYFSPLIMR